MRWAALAFLLSGCAHVPVASDFTRAIDAALQQSVEELLEKGMCTPRVALTCQNSSSLSTREGIVHFDRSGTRQSSTLRCDEPATVDRLCERATFSVRRVGVTVRRTLGGDTMELQAWSGQQFELGPVEAKVGFGTRGPVVVSLRRVPDGVSVLTGELPTLAPMHEVRERSVIELPARFTIVIGKEWMEFSLEITREVFELNVPTEHVLTVGSR